MTTAGWGAALEPGDLDETQARPDACGSLGLAFPASGWPVTDAPKGPSRRPSREADPRAHGARVTQPSLLRQPHSVTQSHRGALPTTGGEALRNSGKDELQGRLRGQLRHGSAGKRFSVLSREPHGPLTSL